MPNLNYHQFIYLVLLCLLPALSMGQDVYEGQIINSVTEAPLSNATATLVKAKRGTASNQQGYFRLVVREAIPDDTLVFSFVGFKSYRLPVSTYEPNIFIRLEPANNQLAQVTIGPGKAQTTVLEKFNYGFVRDIRGKNPYFTSPYAATGWFAKEFEAPKNGAVLTAISLGRRVAYDIPILMTDYPRSSTNKLTRFLLHIYTCDTLTSEPDKKIFTKEVTLNDNSLMINFDMVKEKIVIPDKKFFVAIQWLRIPLNEIIIMDIGYKKAKVKKDGSEKIEDVSKYLILYQPFLVRMPGLGNAACWTSQDGKRWQAINVGNIALSATVSY